MDSYDFVIVGGGTAGCVLAARLSESPEVSVLLLEAGAAESPAGAEYPPAWPALLQSPANWGDVALDQTAAGRPVAVARGRVLGGPGTIPLAEITGAIPGFMSLAATSDLPIDIDEVPLAEVEPAWHRRSGGRRIVFRP